MAARVERLFLFPSKLTALSLGAVGLDEESEDDDDIERMVPEGFNRLPIPRFDEALGVFPLVDGPQFVRRPDVAFLIGRVL